MCYFVVKDPSTHDDDMDSDNPSFDDRPEPNMIESKNDLKPTSTSSTGGGTSSLSNTAKEILSCG